VFRPALRQTESLIGSIVGLLGLELRVPDHSTLSRRAKTLEVPRPHRNGRFLHLLVDSTGLRLCCAGEWLREKHGIKTRRSWRKLHIGVDAGSGQVVATTLTAKEIDDDAEVGPLLDQAAKSLASFTADGGYDQNNTHDEVLQRHLEAAVVVPPRTTAVPGDTAETAPTQRDRHSPAYRRARAHGLAEGVRLHGASTSRGRNRTAQAGDRGRVALARGRPSGDRGERRRRCAQPLDGAWTPELRPHRLTTDGVGATMSTFKGCATR